MPVVIFRLGPAVGKTWRSLNKEMLIEGESDDNWGKGGAKRSPPPSPARFYHHLGLASLPL